jgi:hypothetical protein
MKRSVAFAAFTLTVGLLGFAESNAQRPVQVPHQRPAPAFTVGAGYAPARTTPKPPPPPRCPCPHCCF